jgi:hypothetical protein
LGVVGPGKHWRRSLSLTRFELDFKGFFPSIFYYEKFEVYKEFNQ